MATYFQVVTLTLLAVDLLISRSIILYQPSWSQEPDLQEDASQEAETLDNLIKKFTDLTGFLQRVKHRLVRQIGST